MILVVVVLLIVTGYSSVSLRNSIAMQRQARRQVWMEQAQFLAQAGAEEAARIINTSSYLGADVTTSTLTLPDGQVADITITPANNQGKEFSIQSTATVEGITRTVNIGRIYRPTYLEYATFYEDFQNLWYIYGFFSDGKIWTGTKQNIYGYDLSNGERYGPIFQELNETKASKYGGYPEYAASLDPSLNKNTYTYADLEFWDENTQGYETGVDKPDLFTVDFADTSYIASTLDVDPALLDPTQVHPNSKPAGKALKFNGRTEVRFSVKSVSGQEVGVAEFRNKDKFGDWNWHPVYSESIDLIYVANKSDGDADHRAGTLVMGDTENDTPNILKGNMSIWTEDDVTLPTHVVYHNQNLEESTDKLGVISKDDIWIDRTKVGDLVLQGGYIASGAISENDTGVMGLVDYNNSVVRGKLHFLGSRVAQRVQAYGVFSGSSFVSGYQTEATFDWRFATAPPPFTPVIGSEIRYEGWH